MPESSAKAGKPDCSEALRALISAFSTKVGGNGFGYDPIFYVPTHGCASAELAPEIKNTISHRGLALTALLKELKVC